MAYCEIRYNPIYNVEANGSVKELMLSLSIMFGFSRLSYTENPPIKQSRNDIRRYKYPKKMSNTEIVTVPVVMDISIKSLKEKGYILIFDKVYTPLLLFKIV